MNDVRTPLSFHPSTTTDHAMIEIKATVTAGFTELLDEALKDFDIVMKSRIESTGVRVDLWATRVIKEDPYCGSKREKLRYDAEYDLMEKNQKNNY